MALLEVDETAHRAGWREAVLLHVHVSVSLAKYGTLTALTIFGHKRGAHEFVEGDRSFWGYA